MQLLLHLDFHSITPTKDNTGKITISDLRGVYTAKYHPKFISGKMTEDEVFGEFLQTFTQSTKVHLKMSLNIESLNSISVTVSSK